MSGAGSTQVVQGVPDDMLYHYGAVLGVIMACGHAAESQVQKMLEVIGSNPDHAYEMLLAFVAYQASRGQLSSARTENERRYYSTQIARHVVETLSKLATVKGTNRLSQEELLKVFGIAKWVYRAVTKIPNAQRRLCSSIDLRNRIDQIIARLPNIPEIIKQIMSIR